MGKGDKRTRRGKIFAGSFGKTRPKYSKKNAANVKKTETKTEAKPTKPAVMPSRLAVPCLASWLMASWTGE